MKSQCLSLDRISTLPQNIIDDILTLMPIRDALRTSVLSKTWRYSWRTMPKLTFTDDMVEVPPDCGLLKKFKLVTAICHILLGHKGPKIVEFNCLVGDIQMVSEFNQIISFLSTLNDVNELSLASQNDYYKLPASFFSLRGLENIKLERCVFEPPLTFDGFSCLKIMTLSDVEVSAKMLERFLPKCPQLKHIILIGEQEDVDFVAGDKFTFFDLLQCVPMIQALGISDYYMKYLSVGGMPRKLPSSPLHLEHLFLHVCMTKQNETSSLLCMIMSSPLLVKIGLWVYGDEKLCAKNDATNLDPDDYSDLKLDHLKTLKIEAASITDFMIDFVKLIMAKSPVLKMVQIKLYDSVSVNEELKMLKDLVQRQFPRASPSANLFIVRDKHDDI